MIKLERPQLNNPAALALIQKAAVAKQVLIDAFERQSKPQVDDTLYKSYKEYSLKAFHFKCAYCESKISNSQPGDVEHFRPKNRVVDKEFKPIKVCYPTWGERDHLGYFWLAYDYDNLLPACADCNRFRLHLGGAGVGKADRFPVAGFRAFLPGDEARETALLIDPTKEDPNNHFQFFEGGTMRALTEAGYETIELLGLNTREVLVKERKRAYFYASNVLSNFIEEAKRTNAQVDDLREEVNQIWAGETSYAAFGRRGLETIRSNLKRQGVAMPLPLGQTIFLSRGGDGRTDADRAASRLGKAHKAVICFAAGRMMRPLTNSATADYPIDRIHDSTSGVEGKSLGGS